MSYVAVKKASLWREAWRGIKASASEMGPSVAGFGALLSVFYFLIAALSNTELAEKIQENPQLLKQHPELAQQYLHEILLHLLWLLPLMVVMSVGYYLFTVMYLRLAMKNNRPAYSVGGYFYWLRKTVWKLVKPSVWILIPIIGLFFYVRSVVRYQVVSPLAVLRRGKELKSSWTMTEGNWWRIFLNAIAIGLVLALLVFVIALPIGFVVGFVSTAAHIGKQASGVVMITSLIQGMSGAVMMASTCIYSCTVFRILSLEARKPSSQTPVTEIASPTA